ncbi:HK97-gp10 family putative phage morphogenesis protein [Xanthobacter sediminis]
MAVLGLDRLRRKLKKLPTIVENEIMAAMEAAAQEVVDLAKSLVPVDEGDLRDSIGWTWGDPPRGSITLARGKRVRRKNKVGPERPVRITIYAGDDDAFYARWVEFGTRATAARASRRSRKWRTIVVMTKARKAHAATPAQPFFFPAWRAMRKRVKGRVSRAITKAAKKVAAQ